MAPCTKLLLCEFHLNGRQRVEEGQSRLCPGLNIYTRSKNCLTDSEVSEDERARLMTEEARIEWVHARSGIGRKENLIDELRLCGEYTRLRVRAEDKKRVLDISGSKNSSLADVGMTEETLCGGIRNVRASRCRMISPPT